MSDGNNKYIPTEIKVAAAGDPEREKLLMELYEAAKRSDYTQRRRQYSNGLLAVLVALFLAVTVALTSYFASTVGVTAALGVWAGMILLMTFGLSASNGRVNSEAARYLRELEFASTPSAAPSDLKKKDSMLTYPERKALGVLRRLFPYRKGFEVKTQVRAHDLVDSEQLIPELASKSIDFVVVDKHSQKPRLVIELDDPTHEQADRVARDKTLDTYLVGSGYVVIHLQFKSAKNIRYDRMSGIRRFLRNKNGRAVYWDLERDPRKKSGSPRSPKKAKSESSPKNSSE